MEAQTFHFNHPVGSFKESVRAYRKYKKEWRAKMEVKLAKMEEEIMQAKADPFYKALIPQHFDLTLFISS